MDNSKLDQGEGPSSSLSQIKVRQGTSNGPERGKVRQGSRASNASVVDTGSPIASVKDAVSMFGSPIGSVRDAAARFGGATNWKTNRVHSMERRKSFQETETPETPKTPEESRSRAFIERRKSFQEPQKVPEEAPVLNKPSERVEESRSRSFSERRKSFQDSEKVPEKLPVLKRPLEMPEESRSPSFIERFKNLEKAQEGKPVLKRQSETDSKNRLLKERQQSLERVHEDLPVLKKQWETAEESKNLILKDLNRITKLIEEHKFNLEKAQKEEHQAKQDYEVAKRRVEELEKGIGHEANAAAKAQFKVAKGRTLAAESDLQSLKDELNKVRKDHASMINDRDTAVKKAEKTVSASKEVEKTVENLTIELRTAKTSLESVHTANAEADAAIASAKKKFEEVKLDTEKAKYELNLLKEASTPLKSQLESEKSALETIRQRQERLSVTVASTEAEVNRTMEEISLVQANERKVREEVVEITEKLQKASEEADEAKSLAKAAHEELQKATEEVDQVKSRASTSEGKYVAAKKEMEAAKAAENLALATINALEETETAQTPDSEDSPSVIAISSEEYYKLKKQGHEAEVQANMRVAESLLHTKAANQSQSRILIKLEEISSELATKKEALRKARQRAEKASERKLSVEQDLTKWRANHEEQKSNRSENENRSPRVTFNDKISKNINETDAVGPSPKASESSNTETDSASPRKKKKKLFPRLFMFLGKKKSRSKVK
ncbi:protein WEAK CHLOROPLAST MOVEMENT UNDER BLUE LIGHT 1-like [Apium graveolens]|uniref:protein WEAK CHLOROPLAST MOVEMENT UNDER BLUE LIGHT 1-like n=1 Tax=Apium graveolens TaxID=4045 RepID=UPI003D7A19C0